MLVTFALRLPESQAKPPLLHSVMSLCRTLDYVGLVLLAAPTVMLLLAITWGGIRWPWSSSIIIGLLCGTAGLLVLFGLWVWRLGDLAIITPACLGNRTVYAGGLVMFFQGGITQLVSYYLPFWFQAVQGVNATTSAVHLLPSLISNIIALVLFGAAVRKLYYIPPWAIVGSALSCIGSGLLTTLKPDTSSAKWIGYQIITTFGRGLAFQVVSRQ